MRAPASHFELMQVGGSAPESIVQIVGWQQSHLESRPIVWQFQPVDAEEATAVYTWMNARPESWLLWGRLATAFGANGLLDLVVNEALREWREQASAAALADEAQEESNRKAAEIKLYIDDKRGGRRGLLLRSSDGAEPFWKMHYSERWERERVLDWMRWQRAEFAAWREFVAEHGAMKFEQRLMAEMRRAEANIRSRGLAARGNRPLRFWRGE